ncbi:YrhC family protein [Halobacillus salinarum]|uniref:YrhC family protein n=1 Tax=Halobacillus salinarum TaxID=2932257 RepID=A0ABY4EPK6_9BACI|nr:YrhC family protein [Halobacillus salinarum]UOQ46305.1 YrhC family protein [Halobacillus salinarum]
MKSTKWMTKKISDFKRFTMTLLILSSYLYIGSLISIFAYHSSAYKLLLPAVVLILATALTFTFKIKKWQHIQQKE